MPIQDGLKIVHQIWQNAETNPSVQLHAILDAARDTRIHSKLAESEVEVAPLFRGDKARELAAVGPYLVTLERENAFTDWFFTYGWGSSWGIIVESTLGLVELRRHFQGLLTVYDESGKPLYFRYYDPRVFRHYLPTCTESELEAMFGPASSFYVEGEETSFLIHYTLADRKLVERKVPL